MINLGPKRSSFHPKSVGYFTWTILMCYIYRDFFISILFASVKARHTKQRKAWSGDSSEYARSCSRESSLGTEDTTSPQWAKRKLRFLFRSATCNFLWLHFIYWCVASWSLTLYCRWTQLTQCVTILMCALSSIRVFHYNSWKICQLNKLVLQRNRYVSEPKIMN